MERANEKVYRTGGNTIETGQHFETTEMFFWIAKILSRHVL